MRGLVAMKLLCIVLVASAAHAVASSVRVLSSHKQQSDAEQAAIDRLCVLDALQMEIECSDMPTALLQVWRQPGEATDRAAAATLYSNESVRCGQEQTVAIECLLNPDHCKPDVLSISLNTNMHVLSVHFDAPTTMPKLMTRSQVIAALEITPQPQEPMVGDWIAQDRLDIFLGSMDSQRLLAAHEHHKLEVAVQNTQSLQSVEGEAEANQFKRHPVRLRFQEHGSYVVALVHDSHFVDSFNVSVAFCSETPILRPISDPSHKQNAGHQPVGVFNSLKPEVSMTGVLAVAPQQGLAFHPPSFFRNDKGWTLAFWLFLDEPLTPPSSFRTLFYKGVGDQRTPSAWLLPDSRNVALRASTVKDDDVGATSTVELPVQEWVHLAFVFDNTTAEFTYKFFVNGRIDVSLHYQHTVLVNNGSLHVLKDPTHAGPPALITGLKIWDSPLVVAAIEAVYTASDISAVSAWTNQGFEFSRSLVLDNKPDTSTRDSTNSLSVSISAPCDDLLVRLDHYQQNALRNVSASTLSFAAVSLFGAEHASIACEDDKKTSFRGDFQQGMAALLQAAAHGESDAWFYVAVAFLSGLANDQLLPSSLSATQFDEQSLSLQERGLPAELAYLRHVGAEPCPMLGVSALHIAALKGSKSAMAALAWRYKRGLCVPKCQETAAWYAVWAGETAADWYSRKNSQPLLQRDRISASTGQNLYESQRGFDDPALQAQIALAEQGDIPALMATGNLFYYGARGLPRDQPRAFEYFERAAGMQHNAGMVATANMLIKGEGAEQNVTRALQLFEQAAEEGSVQALNGLGFLYFNGDAVPQNMTRAFHYFSLAAKSGATGDAFFNAAYCLFYGHGTEVDHAKAIALFDKAARRFGHFSSIWELGQIRLDGKVVARSASAAVEYLIPATQIGPWGEWLRRAFDFYLHGNVQLAFTCYLIAAQLGYEEAFSNAAFIAKHKLPAKTAADLFGDKNSDLQFDVPAQQAIWAAVLGSQDAYRFVGDQMLERNSGQNHAAAIWWLSKASQQGNSRASLTLAFLHATKREHQRYKHLYDRYLDLAIAQEKHQQLKQVLRAVRLGGTFAMQLGACMALPTECRTDVIEASLLTFLTITFGAIACVAFRRRRRHNGRS